MEHNQRSLNEILARPLYEEVRSFLKLSFCKSEKHYCIISRTVICHTNLVYISICLIDWPLISYSETASFSTKCGWPSWFNQQHPAGWSAQCNAELAQPR